MTPRLPDYCIIGAQKSGTTSLARYLGAHPGAFMAPTKELHYFDRKLAKGDDWYRGQFRDAASDEKAGEATPMYLYEESVPARMAALVPDIRLVAILRDPVDRAYSHYWHSVAKRQERLSFTDAIDAESSRLAGGDAEARIRYSYVDRGRYVDQLRRYAEHFNREQLLVLFLDDLGRDPATVFATMCEHVGVDPTITPDEVGRRYNPYSVKGPVFWRRAARFMPTLALKRRVRSIGSTQTTYDPMPDDVRAMLRETFAASDAALAAWLGRPLPW